MQLTGKLTPKALGWDRFAIGGAVKDTTQRVKLGTIVGIVSGLRQTVNNETGDIQTGLKGNFRGVSTLNLFEIEKDAEGNDKMKDGKPVMLDTGKVISVTSGVCYLPGGIQDMIEGALAAAKEKDAKATVSFGIDLYAVKDTNKAGYTFNADTKVETAERDPLDLLLEQASGAVALPAPETTEERADAETVSEGANATDPKATGKAK
jgi:hypothetical protein